MSPSFPPDTAQPCVVRPSPNHGDRRGRDIDAIVLHYTGMPNAEGALRRLCDPAAEVSSHYLIDEAGTLYQLVAEDRRAWHAGRSYWQGERDLNSVSIGIEIANAGHDGGLPAFPEAQVATVTALCRDIMERRRIAPERVLGHSDIAPGRKIDPGERFPWQRLAAAGIGRWPVAQPGNGPIYAWGARGHRIAALQQALATWGIEATSTGDYDRQTKDAIFAFQQRYRQTRVDGIVDAETLALLATVVADMQRCSGG